MLRLCSSFPCHNTQRGQTLIGWARGAALRMPFGMPVLILSIFFLRLTYLGKERREKERDREKERGREIYLLVHSQLITNGLKSNSSYSRLSNLLGS